MENNSNLPQELLEDILSRVPYRSLSRFKCVCKLWYSLLNGPTFLPPHLSPFINHHSFPNTSVILSLPLLSDGLRMLHCKLFSLSHNDSSAVNTQMPSFFADTFPTSFRISGHCNGILCLSSRHLMSLEVVLYNPATREFKYLPDSIMYKDGLRPFDVGMGYDSRSDDYKVVRIWGWWSDNQEYFTKIVDEYSLNCDSWTRLHNSNVKDFNFYNYCFALFFKGTYYWWGVRPGDTFSKILGLNMGDEVFYQVPVPQNAVIEQAGPKELLVWKESISLICFSYCGSYGSPEKSFDIWVMDGFGAQASWTKMHTITNGLPTPLAFWKGNELLLQEVSGEIKSYNVDTQEMKNFKIDGGNPARQLAQAVNYVATLVSIKGNRYVT